MDRVLTKSLSYKDERTNGLIKKTLQLLFQPILSYHQPHWEVSFSALQNSFQTSWILKLMSSIYSLVTNAFSASDILCFQPDTTRCTFFMGGGSLLHSHIYIINEKDTYFLKSTAKSLKTNSQPSCKCVFLIDERVNKYLQKNQQGLCFGSLFASCEDRRVQNRQALRISTRKGSL